MGRRVTWTASWPSEWLTVPYTPVPTTRLIVHHALCTIRVIASGWPDEIMLRAHGMGLLVRFYPHVTTLLPNSQVLG